MILLVLSISAGIMMGVQYYKMEKPSHLSKPQYQTRTHYTKLIVKTIGIGLATMLAAHYTLFYLAF